MSIKYAFVFCIYYRKFIKDFSTISKCLHTLTEKGTGFKWTSDFQSAFDILKFRPTNAPILGHPDFNHQFFFDTDASNESIGAGLSQNIDGTGRSVKAEPEKNYLRLYTLWNISDTTYVEKSLLCELTTAYWNGFSSSTILRDGFVADWKSWVPTHFKQYSPGAQHNNADALSRIQCRVCGFQSDWDKDEIIPPSDVRTISEN